MVCAQLNRESGPGATAALAGWIVRESTSPLPARVVAWARHTTLDWLGVAIGGSDSPLVQILTDDVLADGGSGASRLVGRSERTSVAGAALINGAASHVLDFDDVNARMYGHPSVAVVPAVLALAEQRKSRGRNLIEALVVGCEVACRVGDWVGASHDEKGWHATATLGTFGATAGAARLLGLDAEKTAMALGIAATQASGLQSMFGTMCKPLHAGRAAMNGLLAARWAASDSRATRRPSSVGMASPTRNRPRSSPVLSSLEKSVTPSKRICSSTTQPVTSRTRVWRPPWRFVPNTESSPMK